MIRTAALATLLVLCASPNQAQACSCMAMSVEEAVASASTILEARVLSVALEGEQSVVELAVTQAWGDASEHMRVRTAASSAACGFSFVVGETYLIYASGEPDALRVSLCSRTALIEDAAEDRGRLGAGVIPVDIEDETVEPVRPARTEVPARGGCASCAASRSDGTEALALMGLFLLLGALRTKNRP